MKANFIKIYSYKKIKVGDEMLDVLYVDDIAMAEDANGKFKILSGKGKFSYLKLFEEYLSLFNIPLEYDDDFIDYIVDKAYNSGTGYRALSAALTEYFNEILFDLYAGKLDVVKLTRKVGDGNNEKK